MELTEVLPKRLREVRHSAGLSLEELALLADVSPSVLSRAERGLCRLGPGSRVRVVRALQLDYEAARRICELAP